MKLSLRAVLNLVLCFTLAIPSYGMGEIVRPSNMTVRIPALPSPTEEEFFRHGVVRNERDAGNDIEGADPGDFWLFFSQSVHQEEVPVARMLPAKKLRRARLNAVIEKTELLLSNMPVDPAAAGIEIVSDLEYAKHLLEDYQFSFTLKKSDKRRPLQKDLYKFAKETDNVDHFAKVIANNLPMSDAEKARYNAASNGDERFSVVTEYLRREAMADYFWFGRRIDTPNFVYFARGNSKRLEAVVTELRQTRDRWETNEQLNAPNPLESELLTRHHYVNWWNTKIVVSENESPVAELKMASTITGSSRLANSQTYYCAKDSCSFAVVRDGVELNTFNVPARVIATIGQYVVFSHTRSFDDQNGMNHLLFVDLGVHTGLIGNAHIPVYRLPLKNQTEEVRTMVAQDGNLVINGGAYTIPTELLEQASKVYEPIVSLEDHLTNPKSWQQILPIINEIDGVGTAMLDDDLESVGADTRNALENIVDMGRIGRDIDNLVNAQRTKVPLKPHEYDQLKLMHDTIPNNLNDNKATAEELATYKLQVERVQAYHDQIAKSRMLEKMLADSQKELRLSRKLQARLRLAMAAMTAPNPHRSQSIMEALTRWGVKRELVTNPGDPLAAIIKVLDRPVINGGIIAAAVLATTVPESMHVATDMGLTLGNALANYTVGLVGGMAEATQAAFQKSTELIYNASAAKRQYYDNGNGYKTFVGLSAFIAAMASVWFIPNALINIKAFRKDLRQYRRDFAKYQDDVRQGRADAPKPEYVDMFSWSQRRQRALDQKLSAEAVVKRDVNTPFTAEDDATVTRVLDAEAERIKSRRLFTRLKRAAKSATERVALSYQRAKQLITPAMEQQTEAMMDAAAEAEKSPAVDHAETRSPEEHKGFWNIIQQRALVKSIVGGAKSLFRLGKPVDQNAEAEDATDAPEAQAAAEAAESCDASENAPQRTWREKATGLRSMFFSYPAMQCTLESMAHTWNTYMLLRFGIMSWKTVNIYGTRIPYMIAPRPISMATMLLYPNFMQTVAIRREGRTTFPTELNGGYARPFTTRSRAEGRARDFIEYDLTKEHPELAGVDASAVWDSKRYLELLKKFEDEIIDVEAKINEMAFRQALGALTRELKNPNGRLHNIEDMRKLMINPNIRHVASPEVRELTWKTQTFLRVYHETIYNKAMAAFLEKAVLKETAKPTIEETVAVTSADEAEATELGLNASEVATVQASADVKAERTALALKDRILALRTVNKDQPLEFKFDLNEAEAVATAELSDDSNAVEEGLAAVGRGRLYSGNVVGDMRNRMISAYDPQQESNKSLTRVATVHKMLQSPGAITRAVRSEITRLLISVPLELATKLLLTAAVFSGSLMPIQDVAFAKYALFYLSIQTFYGDIMYRFVMKMLAESWTKLQDDSRQALSGAFDRRVRGEDARRSYLRYYMKQLQEPENSYWANFKNYVNISFWNIPAAFVNIQLFTYIFSGFMRVDLSYQVAGFALMLVWHNEVIPRWFEQAFERSMPYLLRDLPEERLMAHPQAFAKTRDIAQSMRTRFSIFHDVIATVLTQFRAQLLYVSAGGMSRRAMRAITGGHLIEERLVLNVIEPLKGVTGELPKLARVADPILETCRSLLTKGNIDLIPLPGVDNGKAAPHPPGGGGH